jgi:mannan endo-1,4-beta-mannosidase
LEHCIFIRVPVGSLSNFVPDFLNWDLTYIGSETNAWGSPWATNHGKVCVAVGKPCILEEYGMGSNKPSIEGPWQTTAMATDGIAGDMLWQYGDTLSSGKTADDGNTIYYGTSDFTSLVTNHVAAIKS